MEPMMSITTESQALQRITPLCALPPNKLKLLAFECQLTQFEEGATILKQGLVRNDFFAVVEGSIEYVVEKDGNLKSLLEDFAEDNVMAIGFLECFAQMPPKVGVRAATNVAALCIPRDTLIDLFYESADLTREMLREICRPPLKLVDAILADRHDEN
jgi:CRP-like cAMP-binding protein